MNIKYILFDLDGTITRSDPGITKCVQYALHCLGIEEPDRNSLLSFVGPPLNVEFKRRFGLNDEQTEYAVKKYRERYATDGIFDCSLYDGIPEMLSACKSGGRILAVASSKPEPYVKRILENFDIAKYFDVIKGSSPDEELNRAGADQKEYIVRKTLEQLQPETTSEAGSIYHEESIHPDMTAVSTAPGKFRQVRQSEESTERKPAAVPQNEFSPIFLDTCAMVGDRCYDMQGALANHIHAIGAAYGYGSTEELRSSGAQYILNSPEELPVLLGMSVHTN